jgi:hypothetical protein
MNRPIAKILEVGKVYFCGTHQRDVEIIHLSGEDVACRAIGNSELFWGGEFSEAYTPEQIAEKKAKQEVIDEIGRIILLSGPVKSAERLYDAGYRKFEITEE